MLCSGIWVLYVVIIKYFKKDKAHERSKNE